MNDSPPPIVRPDVLLVEDLIKEIDAGRLRIPRFQRPYVWKPEDMRALFQSIYQGYPIGSLLLWETSASLKSLDTVGPLPVPQPAKGMVSYVLDGQQRLATLYAVLRLPPDMPRDQGRWPWWLWYDLQAQEFVHVQGGASPGPTLFPLRALLRTMNFLAAAGEIIKAVPRPEQAQALISRAEDLAQRVKSYKLTVIRIQGGTLDQAVEIFSRLNTKGQPMAPDQMVSALTYQEGEGSFHLTERIDEILRRLAEYHFDTFPRIQLFRTIIVLAGHDVAYGSEWGALADKLRQAQNLPMIVDQAEAALVRAARFLYDELGVKGAQLLPYAQQLMLLTQFFHHQADPSPAQRALLRRWFWATSFTGWFAGANRTQIDDALREMQELAEGRRTTFQVVPLDAPCRPFPSAMEMRSARARALLLVMMNQLRPLDLAGGEVPASALIWALRGRALIPVFPKERGHWAANPGNRLLLQASKGTPVRTRLLAIPDSIRQEVLSSHGISAEALRALEQGDAPAFISARAHQLARAEREFMKTLDLTLPEAETAAADIDTDDEE